MIKKGNVRTEISKKLRLLKVKDSMKSIPIIGDVAHVFEILVPGMFLLLNFMGVIYFSSDISGIKDELLKLFTTDPVLSFLLVISFSYLLGIMLRMLRCKNSDACSGKFLLFREERKRKKEDKLSKSHSLESKAKPDQLLLFKYSFPYSVYLGSICEKNYVTEAFDFYKKVWSPENRRNANFFNFCKTMVVSEDAQAGIEIQYAESLSRYISSMFYAIVFSIVVGVVTLFVTIFSGHNIGTIILLILFIIGYLCFVVVILLNYRLIRMKEVSIVFIASYKNRHLFEQARRSD